MNSVTIKYASKEYQIKITHLSVENLCNLFGIKNISHIMIPYENTPLFPNEDGSWSASDIQAAKTYQIFLKREYFCSSLHCCIHYSYFIVC